MTDRYFTITHLDSGAPLGVGGNLSRASAYSILTSRRTNDDGSTFSASEYSVAAWEGDGGDGDDLLGQVNGAEFVACKGMMPEEV